MDGLFRIWNPGAKDREAPNWFGDLIPAIDCGIFVFTSMGLLDMKLPYLPDLLTGPVIEWILRGLFDGIMGGFLKVLWLGKPW